MLIEVSTIKNYGSSNLNRDNTGAAKTAVFGGINRVRVSSQCLKMHMRKNDFFKELLEENSEGIRTKKIYDRVWDKVKEQGVDDEYYAPIVKLLSTLGKKEVEAKLDKLDNKEENLKLTKDDKEGTSQIITYSTYDIEAISNAVIELIKEVGSPNRLAKLKNGNLTNIMKKSLNRPITLDIALFGRMVSTTGMTNIEASTQVAHSISTHKAVIESDFFVAVDDLVKERGEKGSAHLDEAEYNSSCFYNYMNIDTDKLKENLEMYSLTEEEVRYIIGGLVKTFIITNPKGKQNSYAAHALPEVVMIEMKDKKVPLNYGNAFVEPVSKYTPNGIVKGSIERLAEEVDIMDSFYSLELKERLWMDIRGVKAPKKSSKINNLNLVVDKIVEVLKDN